MIYNDNDMRKAWNFGFFCGFITGALGMFMIGVIVGMSQLP